jgi:hypothetical protein
MRLQRFEWHKSGIEIEFDDIDVWIQEAVEIDMNNGMVIYDTIRDITRGC